MKHEVQVPSAGESVTEVFIGRWLKGNGDIVKKDDTLVDIESQKASFELQSEYAGRLEILKPEPQTKVNVGEVIAYIDDSAAGHEKKEASPKNGSKAYALAVSAPKRSGEVVLSPAAPALNYFTDEARGDKRIPASQIRRHIAQNLVAAQHTAAILTTFNEVDMSAVMEFRKKYKDKFKEKFGASLGMVGFFALAAVRALKEYPLMNAVFTGEDIIERDYVDISIAMGTERGLVVPVIRDVQNMGLNDFEKKLGELSDKAKNKKLSIPEMTGGTFTISNGGVFGSLLSTPILNMPQSGILGLHKIEERAVVVKGQIVARSMMYLALSYDHRIIDGREAVLFLVKIKEGIENLGLIVNEKSL